MNVTETTHHGSYRHVRELTLTDLSPVSVLAALRGAVYPILRPESVAAAVSANLGRHGRADHGWVTWEVTD